MHMPTPTQQPAATTEAPALHAKAGRPSTDACVRWVDAEGRRFALRPLRPDDAALLGHLWNEQLSRTARFNRFHASLGTFSPERLKGCCQVDSTTGGAFLITQAMPGGEVALAEGRWAWKRPVGSQPSPHRRWAELSLSVADRWQACGLGLRTVQALMLDAQKQGARGFQAQVLPGNRAMQALLGRSGFTRCSAGTACNTDTDTDTDTFECAEPAWPGTPAAVAQRSASGVWHLVAAARLRVRLFCASLSLGSGLNSSPCIQRSLAAADPETRL